MKTIKKYLGKLPEPYRTQAIENSKDWSNKLEVESLSQAISNAFIWNNTPQGHNYWENFVINLKKNETV
jgi:hypothetical protein